MQKSVRSIGTASSSASSNWRHARFYGPPGSLLRRQPGGSASRATPPAPFRYRHFGSLATIGRQAAVVELGPVHISGALAWWFWGAAHVLFLVGGRNRATVLLDWLWAYLTYRRSTRLITGEASVTLPSLGR